MGFQALLVVDVLALVELDRCPDVVLDVVASLVALFPVLDLLRGVLVLFVIGVIALLRHGRSDIKERVGALSYSSLG